MLQTVEAAKMAQAQAHAVLAVRELFKLVSGLVFPRILNDAILVLFSG